MFHTLDLGMLMSVIFGFAMVEIKVSLTWHSYLDVGSFAAKRLDQNKRIWLYQRYMVYWTRVDAYIL